MAMMRPRPLGGIPQDHDEPRVGNELGGGRGGSGMEEVVRTGIADADGMSESPLRSSPSHAELVHGAPGSAGWTWLGEDSRFLPRSGPDAGIRTQQSVELGGSRLHGTKDEMVREVAPRRGEPPPPCRGGGAHWVGRRSCVQGRRHLAREHTVVTTP